MTAGTLNQRITIQHLVESANALREKVQSWADLYRDMSARAMRASVSEPVQASQLQSIGRVRFRVRYRSDITITAAMRIVWKGVPYAIIGEPMNVAGQNEWLDIEAQAGARDGR